MYIIIWIALNIIFNFINMRHKKMSPKLQLLLFILEHSENITDMTEMKVYKLMYFLEKEYYETYWKSFIGNVLLKRDHWPVIDNIKSDVLFWNFIELNFRDWKSYYSLKNNNFTLSFKEDERGILLNWLERYKRLTASDLRSLSHNEAPFLMSLKWENIDISNVVYNTVSDSDECDEEQIELHLTQDEQNSFLKNLKAKYG